MTAAFADAARSTPADLMAAAALLRSGASPDAAWAEVGGAGRDPLARAALALARDTGAPLADVLERVADHARDRARFATERDAALAGPRASAALLQWLPIVGLGFAAAIDPGALALLATTPLGWALVALAGSLTWAGRRWMRALVERAERAGGDGALAGLTVALVEAAVRGGRDVASALTDAGRALGGDGQWLVRVATRLHGGATWDAAWADASHSRHLERALAPAWRAGASPVLGLRAVAAQIADDARADSTEATARLAVHASLPLAVCLLPAFILVGVVPMVLAVAVGAAGGVGN